MTNVMRIAHISANTYDEIIIFFSVIIIKEDFDDGDDDDYSVDEEVNYDRYVHVSK
jgi:hypothetical protein